MSKIKPIKNALSNIRMQCETRLHELYSDTIPTFVRKRYEQELLFLKESPYIDDFEIFRRLSNQAKKCSSFISIRGTLSGSYLIYLLDSSHWNPLPMHYYCPKCGSFELVETSLFSFDLPNRKCPKCDATIYADGYNLSSESVWGLDGKKIISFDYNIPSDFLPFAKRTLENIYPDNLIAPYGLFTKDRNATVPCMEHSGFVVLPENQSMQDYPDYQGYLEDGEMCLTCSLMDLQNLPLKRITLIPNTCMNLIWAMQNCTGIFLSDITKTDLKELSWNNIANTYIFEPTADYLLHTYKPRTFSKLCELTAVTHNTYANVENLAPDIINHELPKWLDSEVYSKCICATREDFYDVLIQFGYSLENAFTISELIRKGRANVKPELFEKYNLPSDIMNVAKNCFYLFPRAHIIESMFLYYRLAYYVKSDSKSYRKITQKLN